MERDGKQSALGGYVPSLAAGNHVVNGHPEEFTFQPPTPSIKHSVLRGDGTLWTLDANDTDVKWHSVSRPPTRAECWTHSDRFQSYQNPSPEMLNLISANNDKNKQRQRAIVLRLSSGQPWNEHFIWFVRSLVMEAGHLAGWDVIILNHLDAAPGTKEREEYLSRIPEEFWSLLQTFSTAELHSYLSTDKKKAAFKSVYEHNHTPLQRFMSLEENKHYEFIYSVESDVRLIGRWDQFLADVDNEYEFHLRHKGEDQTMPPDWPDLVSFQAIRRPKDDWMWLTNTPEEKACVKRFGKANVRASVGPVWGWSRRLVEAMDAYNTDHVRTLTSKAVGEAKRDGGDLEKGINCYYEYFAPSVAYARNLTTFFYQHPLYCPGRNSPSDRHSLKPEERGRNDPRLVQIDKVAVGCTVSLLSPLDCFLSMVLVMIGC